MARIKVYYAKTDNLNDFGQDGWEIMNPMVTGNTYVVYKMFEAPFDSEIVQSLIQVYNSTGWQQMTIGVDNTDEKAKDGMYWKYFADQGIKFVPDGSKWRVDTDDDKTRERLCTWRVEADYGDEDHLLRICPYDVTFPNPIYAAKVIDQYKEASDIIDKAMTLGMVGYKLLRTD